MTRRRQLLLSIALTGLAALLPAEAGAQAQRLDPDWPCIQRKVPDMSIAQVWTGPPIEDEQLQNWRSDAEIVEEVPKLAARRVPIADAEAEIARFAEELDQAGKGDRLTLLFAAIFSTLDAERADVMEGIERYGRRQKAMAEEIRVDQARLSDLRSASPDSPETAALNDDLLSRIRVFDDRRTSLSYVCEVPTLIEERMFALGRAIAKITPN